MSKSSLNSVHKTFRLIECFCEERTGYRLTDLALKLDISISSVQRITNTLIELGYLKKNRKGKELSLSPKCLSMGFAFLDNLEIRKIALPYLKAINKETNETICLAIRDDDEVLYIESILTPHLIAFHIRPGLRRPMYPNSIGKVILAFLPDDERNRLIDHLVIKKAETYKPVKDTLQSKADIRRDISGVKKAGHAVTQVQFSGGGTAIAFPIFNHEGQPVAGMNINIPTIERIERKLFNSYLKLLKDATDQISSELGYGEYLRHYH